jgi:hypothetical protein
MKSRVLSSIEGRRSLAAVFERGDDAVEGLERLALQSGLRAASVSGVGGFERITLGYFDVETKQYERICMEEQVELLSLSGNLSCEHDGHPKVHLHAVVGRRDGTVRGGHLFNSTVRPTLEVIIVEEPDALRRRQDPDSGLALLRLEEGT